MDERRRSSAVEKPKRTLRQRAIALLARREYARAELAARLAATGAGRDEIETLLDDLERRGYLSDARFAGAVVRQKAGSFAKRAIGQSLRERGVSADVAREALAELGDRDEFAEALALWQRRFGRAPADERDRARQLRFLVSRGYAAAVAFRVLRSASAGSGDEPHD